MIRRALERSVLWLVRLVFGKGYSLTRDRGVWPPHHEGCRCYVVAVDDRLGVGEPCQAIGGTVLGIREAPEEVPIEFSLNPFADRQEAIDEYGKKKKADVGSEPDWELEHGRLFDGILDHCEAFVKAIKEHKQQLGERSRE